MIRHRNLWLGMVLVAMAGIGIIMVPRPQAAPPALAGTLLPETPAPQFRLADQFGRTVSLAQYRGRPVVLTFMEAHCRELCPTVAEKLRRVLAELGPDGQQVGMLALSTDPEGDTRPAARAFSHEHGLLHSWHYLLGTRKQLAPIWKAYYVYAAPANAPPKMRDSHTSAIYLIDASGRERALMGGDPDFGSLLMDLRILLGLPATAGQPADPAPEAGHPAPAFALAALDGKTVHSSDLKHHVVLLNFWATWCTVCKSEMPMLSRWYRELHARGLEILGIDQQESAAAARAFVRRFHIRYPVLEDDSGTTSARYDVVGLPTTLLVDQSGIVEAVKVGVLDRRFLTADVAPLLGARLSG
jgi:protein SCO1